MDFFQALKTFFLAMTPVGELRIALPMCLTLYNLNPIACYFFSVLGNLFSVFLILVFLGIFSRWASKNIYFFSRFFSWLFSRTKKNHNQRISKYGFFLLPLLVSIPLPVTGGWTASLVAFVFGIPFKKAFPLIGTGILFAGLIVFFLTKTGIVLEKYLGWQMLFGILLIFAIIYYWLYKISFQKSREQK